METSFRLGEWLVDPLHGQIVGPGGSLRLEPRVMRVLVCLAEKCGEIVSREQLIEQVWEGTFVTDEVLTQSVSELRKALGEAPKDARFIQTIPKQGYRLIAPVVLSTHSVDVGAGSFPGEAAERTPSATDAGSGTGLRSRERIVWTVGVGLLSLAAILAGGFFLELPDPRMAIRLALTLPPEVFPETLALSPDGKWLAFIVADEAGNAIWVRELESGKTQPLTGTEGVIHLFWSPDSRYVGFSTLGALKKIKLVGGPPETVREGEFSWGGTWNDDGVMVLANLGELYRVAAAGGEPSRLPLADGFGGRVRPYFLPDGVHLLYFATPASGSGRIYVGSIASGESRFLTDSDSKAVYADGYLLFVRGGVLMAQRFDARNLRLEGEPRVIGPQLISPAVVGRTDTPFSVARNGLLVFRSSSGAVGQLVWFDRQGRELGRVPEPESGEYVNPSLSPDGRKIAVNRRDPATGNRDIWLIDTETTIASRFTLTASPEVDPVWSPDGKRIAFAASRSGRWGAWIQEIAGSGEKLLWEAPEDHGGLILTDWSRDGQYILCSAAQGIWVVPVSGDPEPWDLSVGSEDARRYGAHFSPDGKWIAYASSETGIFEIYVVTFPDGENKQRISDHGGVHPLWGSDGRELFYWSFSQKGGFVAPIMRVQMNVEPTGLRHSLPAPLFEPRLAGVLDSRNNFTVAPGSQRFLLRRPLADPPPVTVIANWTAELESASR
jgi:Tol biopolymer transport system component/DNA-binding winged helix-turn-helix (wHTH) protein